MNDVESAPVPPVVFVGAGPGAALHLALAALAALRSADVVVYDRLVCPEVLALIPAKARRIDVGKEGFAGSTAQTKILATMVAHAMAGARVVRLKCGGCFTLGGLKEEIDVVEAAGLPFRIIPGLTAAAVAAATIKRGMARRGRNASLRMLTRHDNDGFGEHDWRGMARPGTVAAIDMGKASARLVRGRLRMHVADPATPVTVLENVRRANDRVRAGTVATQPPAAGVAGPVVILYGLAPRQVQAETAKAREAQA